MPITIMMMLLLCLRDSLQIDALEKRALDLIRQTPVSILDPELTGSSFVAWFTQLTGPEAGVIWQLTECGERRDQQTGAERDLIACVEANAILPDTRKVVVAINVGTFKTGISKQPTFHAAVIERNNQLYPVRRLRDLPGLLRPTAAGPIRSNGAGPSRSIVTGPVRLPKVGFNSRLASRSFNPSYLQVSNLAPYSYPESAAAPAEPTANSAPTPEPSESTQSTERQRPQRLQERLLRGRALNRVNPVFPPNLGTLNVFFRSVEVVVLVSEQGRVIEAKAVSGHPALRGPAVDAARKWVFEPATFAGRPVKVESRLTFVFTPNP